MKPFFLFITGLLLSSGIFSQQQIPNGNFENWTNNEADNWNSSFNIGITIYTATQSSESFQGNSAAELTSQSVFSQFIPGLITLGEVDLANMTLTGGIPYSDRPDGIRFFFKYLPSGIDTMFFGVFLTKLNDVTSNIDTIATTGYLNSNTFNTYTKVELPFIYQSTEIPDTLNIIFSSSGFNGNAGSSLFIDSLSLFNGIPVSPTFCFPAKDLTSSSFTANWMTVPNATSYNLDVSENSDFSSFLTGYENLNTGTDTFYVVNISPGTYYYRVRVNYDTETSINSNTIEVPLENTGIKEFNSEDIKIKSISNLISIETSKLNLDYIEIYNIEGQLIKIINVSGNKAEFSLPTSGMYILKIYSVKKIISKKVNVIF